MEQQPDVSQAMRLLHLICLAILLSIPVYAAAAVLIIQERSGPYSATPVPDPLVPALLVGAALLLLAAPSIGKAVMRPHRNLVGGSTEHPSHRLDRFRTGHILAFALREAAAILGLVLTLITADPKWVLLIGVVTVIAMLLGWPRLSAAERLLQTDTTPID